MSATSKMELEIKQLSINMTNVDELFILIYNMHGFHQGIETMKDLIASSQAPDIILLQEHWLTPANMYLFAGFEL